MLNASVGVQRVLGRLRRPPSNGTASASTVQVRSFAAAGRLQHGLRSAVAASRLVPLLARRDPRTGAVGVSRSDRRSLIARLGPDRTVALAVAGILLGASVISVSAAGPAPSTGGPTGPGTDVRIAVGGVAGIDGSGTISDGAPPIGGTLAAEATGIDQVAGIDQAADIDPSGVATTVAAGVDPTGVQGPFLDDGTLLKPVAVDTTVADGRALVQTYRVEAGDTLVGIAAKFGISMMTIWWANDLESKDALHIGQKLSIPPVTGLVVTVTAADTLDSLAQRYDVDPADILTENKLEDPNLVVGQVLVVPGAAGKGIPTPKPEPGAASRSPSGGSGDGTARSPSTFLGGALTWPVVGGGNYISQYFHNSHPALDIAADYGSTVRAAGAGTVIFAGWKGNGGGYQVWISHGSNLYSGYYHMSAISVGYGQSVAEGQQVGRIGQTGHATGPHLHFEVWVGPINDGYRVNPLKYF